MNTKRKNIYTKALIGFILWVPLFFNSCSLFRDAVVDEKKIQPLSMEQLVLNPFGFQPTIRNFKKNLPSGFKSKVFTTKNRHYPSVTDSIFKFIHGNSELVIYKAYGREIFIGGNIYDRHIVLKNGIQVGMSRVLFLKYFTDLKQANQDTVLLFSKKAINKFNFIFKKDKLKAIKIDNYID